MPSPHVSRMGGCPSFEAALMDGRSGRNVILLPIDLTGDAREAMTRLPASSWEIVALLDRVAAQTETVGTALVDQAFKNTVVTHGAALGIDVQIVEGFVPQPKRWVVEQTYGILAWPPPDPRLRTPDRQ
ncbi:hypothetical protein [Nonomuraea dietziae]|uniref:hypothetical protein n=1 Tax=Nonomuraea dietziae TaxID=65515 RepID=UPI003F4CFF5A